jgi:hypothetical protein
MPRIEECAFSTINLKMISIQGISPENRNKIDRSAQKAHDGQYALILGILGTQGILGISFNILSIFV